MKILSYTQAKIKFITDFEKGQAEQYINDTNKHTFFPYNLRYNNEKFIKIKVNISDIYISNIISINLVNKYKQSIQNGKIMPHVWLSLGKKLENNNIIFHYHKKIDVLDGNHRVSAYKQLKYYEIFGYIPESHLNFSNKVKTWQLEL